MQMVDDLLALTRYLVATAQPLSVECSRPAEAASKSRSAGASPRSLRLSGNPWSRLSPRSQPSARSGQSSPSGGGSVRVVKLGALRERTHTTDADSGKDDETAIKTESTLSCVSGTVRGFDNLD
jgi:hypothetical protein